MTDNQEKLMQNLQKYEDKYGVLPEENKNKEILKGEPNNLQTPQKPTTKKQVSWSDGWSEPLEPEENTPTPKKSLENKLLHFKKKCLKLEKKCRRQQEKIQVLEEEFQQIESDINMYNMVLDQYK